MDAKTSGSTSRSELRRIPKAIAILTEEMQSLEGLHAELEKRLSAILDPDAPCQDKASEKPQQDDKLVSAINAIIERVQQQREMLQGVLDRLEI